VKADVVVSTVALSFDGGKITPLTCSVAGGETCDGTALAAVAACQGHQACDGTTLDIPSEALDRPGGYGIPALLDAAEGATTDGRVMRVSLHPALPYRVVAATIYTLALAGHEDLDLVGLDPRWIRDGKLRYRPPRRNGATSSGGRSPSVTITLSHQGVLELSTNAPDVDSKTLYPNDYGVDLPGLQRWLAALPEQLTAPNVDLVVAAASDIRWGTLARVVAVTRERLPDRGYAYLGALESAVAKQVTGDNRRPLLRRLVFAVAPE